VELNIFEFVGVLVLFLGECTLSMAGLITGSYGHNRSDLRGAGKVRIDIISSVLKSIP